VDPTSSWCCECDKCRFVFLVLAAFLDRETMAGIFGRNLLDDRDAIPGYRELAGLTANRPLDCVGEADEVIAALTRLAQNPDWMSSAVLAELMPEIGADAAEVWARAMQYHDTALPARFDKVLREAL
jgi:hypothetical protein